MCGIFGVIQPGPFDTREIAEVSRVLRHRGPDDEGFAVFGPWGATVYGGIDTPSLSFDSSVSYCPRERLPTAKVIGDAGGIILGHRRLSILDLSAHGHQPMSYRDRYWIVYNGEIYNYLELRDELSAAGYTFSTNSDTEVILAAYDYWGEGCLSRFNGMWGFAILDQKLQTLFLARDRFGVKPLYFSRVGERFAFASEIKAFSVLRDWKARANVPRLLDMLIWNVSDHTSETMFEGVSQLPAGHCISISLSPAFQLDASWQMRPRRWYEIQLTSPMPKKCDVDAVFYELLQDAVKLRLRADVRVGSCLSGGLDSSAVVCLMGRQLAQQSNDFGLHTFTARSADAAFDEFKYAEMAADRASATIHQVTPEPSRLFDELDKLSWHQDEPFVSTSIFAQWCVFDLARRAGVTVMLDGQGADEILCGYRGFIGAYLASLIRRGRGGMWARELFSVRREMGFSPLRSLGYTATYLMPQFAALFGRLDNRAYADRDWLIGEALEVRYADPFHVLGARTASVRDMSLAQIQATNLPMLLHWEDRNSMAFSVEARVPFLDYRVVEFCLNLADEDKIGGGISKAILRRSMRGAVPNAILDRRDKMGFVTAETLWMRRDMADHFRNELEDAASRLSGVISSKVIDQFDEVLENRKPFDHRYWRIMSVGRWMKNFNITL